mmetsp:Transcript_42417/g.102109  ORF Transcript_42417/g.102109 Transcript_42417/m.102109 type:complete len:244 (+) Transcript_42417:246-977(+)
MLGQSVLQLYNFLVFVLDILLLGLSGNLVVLRALLVLAGSRLFGIPSLCQQLAKIRLGHLQHADDARCIALGVGGRGRLTHLGEGLAIIIAQDLECHLHALQAGFVISLCRLERCLLLSPDLRGLTLLTSNVTQLLAEGRHLLFQLGDAGFGIVDLSRQSRDGRLVVVLLGIRLRRFRIAERLGASLLGSLLLKVGNHVLDKALDLGEGVGGAGSHRSYPHSQQRNVAIVHGLAQLHQLSDDI